MDDFVHDFGSGLIPSPPLLPGFPLPQTLTIQVTYPNAAPAISDVATGTLDDSTPGQDTSATPLGTTQAVIVGTGVSTSGGMTPPPTITETTTVQISTDGSGTFAPPPPPPTSPNASGERTGGGTGNEGSPGGDDPYIFFTVQLPERASTGTVITIQGSISNDAGAPVLLPAITYTIDNTPPTSSVTALPTDSSSSFNVSWSGQASEGVGIAFYNVYVSDNGGPYTLWQGQTIATSASFSALAGHTYSFYSQATDNVGNVQPMPTQPQASTTVAVAGASLTQTENGTPAVTTVVSLLGTGFSDPDPSTETKPGIAVVQTAGNGTWEYSTNGTAWSNMGAISTAHALLLPKSYSVRFVPAANTSGPAQLAFLAWDGSAGTPGGYYNITETGGASPFSTNTGSLGVTVNPVPIFARSGAALPSIAPGTYSTNATTPAGSTIASVFGPYLHDDNAAVALGVAITGATGSGTWQYMTSGSTTWTALPAVSSSAALLLSGDDQIRFVPNSGFAGMATITALAWNTAVGTDGMTNVNPSKQPSGTFSTAALTATAAVNTAPTLNATTVTLPAIAANTTSAAATVSTLLGQAGYSNPNGKGLPQGIAIVGSTAAPGTWQYMLPGGSWQPLPSVSAAAALLLPSTSSLRFVADGQMGTPSLTFAGWDETQGTAATLYDITGTGGASAFSTVDATVSVTVQPTVSWSASSGAALAPLLAGTSPAGNPVAVVFGPFFQDSNPGVPVGVVLTGATGTTNGTWQISTTGGASWTAFTAVSSTAALLLSATDQIRFVPASGFTGTVSLTALAWDGSAGTAGTTVNPSKLSSTAFSSTTLTATCSVNTALVLANPSNFLGTIPENAAGPPITVSTLAEAGFTNSEGDAALAGIAIIGSSGLGSWQWKNGSTWTPVPANLSGTLALLLPAAAQVRFQPADNLAVGTTGTAMLTYLGWSQTMGTRGATYALTAVGGATAFSAGGDEHAGGELRQAGAGLGRGRDRRADAGARSVGREPQSEPAGRYRGRDIRQRLQRRTGHRRRRRDHAGDGDRRRHLVLFAGGQQHRAAHTGGLHEVAAAIGGDGRASLRADQGIQRHGDADRIRLGRQHPQCHVARRHVPGQHRADVDGLTGLQHQESSAGGGVSVAAASPRRSSTIRPSRMEMMRSARRATAALWVTTTGVTRCARCS